MVQMFHRKWKWMYEKTTENFHFCCHICIVFISVWQVGVDIPRVIIGLSLIHFPSFAGEHGQVVHVSGEAALGGMESDQQPARRRTHGGAAERTDARPRQLLRLPPGTRGRGQQREPRRRRAGRHLLLLRSGELQSECRESCVFCSVLLVRCAVVDFDSWLRVCFQSQDRENVPPTIPLLSLPQDSARPVSPNSEGSGALAEIQVTGRPPVPTR